MPGPTTEVLNEDIKELKADNREFRSSIEVLKFDVHRIDNNLAELRAEFSFARWLVGLLLVATISGIGGGVWWAATITADMKGLELRIDDKFKAADLRIDDRFKAADLRIDDRFKALEAKVDEKSRVADARFDKIDARFDKIDARFDRMEAILAKLLEQNKSSTKVPAG